MTDSNKKLHVEGGDLYNNDCCDCEEGCLFGKVIYCNINGDFYPLHYDFKCDFFVRR